MNYFGVRLKNLRLQDSLTQADLGKRIGIAKCTISLYENGKREPDFETLEKFADFFNVPMATFFPSSSPLDIEQPVTDAGNELFNKFSKLSAENQDIVRTTMLSMIEQLLKSQSDS